jgi:hypothetical protein
MNLLFLLILPFGWLSPQEKTIRQILGPFNANWRGEFKVYNFDGKLIS